MPQEPLDRVRSIAQPILDSLGYELFDLELTHSGRKGLVRVTIDKAEGISLDDCERVSDTLGHALDAHDPIPYRYALEVSSPGLDRPLKRPQDYTRFSGRLAKLWLAEPWAGQKVLRGRLHGLKADPGAGADECVVIETEAGVEVVLPLARINRARLEVEW